MNLEKICHEVAALARETGKFLRQESSRFDRAKIEYKGINDMVSYVDKETEKLLVKGLKTILPEAGFITEEGTEPSKAGDPDPKKLCWIIDPLDGTTNFIHQLPIYSISIALMRDEEVVVGVVYEVNRDENFYAWKDGGAYLNGESIAVSPAPKLSDGLLATGFPYYDFEKMQAYLEILNELMRRSHGLRRLGSAAIDLAYVACGRFEGYFEYNLKPWDVAGGVLLVKEAGGYVTDFSGGKNFVFGGELVSGGPSQAELLDVIRSIWER